VLRMAASVSCLCEANGEGSKKEGGESALAAICAPLIPAVCVYAGLDLARRVSAM
jgi:hypothetical protein